MCLIYRVPSPTSNRNENLETAPEDEPTTRRELQESKTTTTIVPNDDEKAEEEALLTDNGNDLRMLAFNAPTVSDRSS